MKRGARSPIDLDGARSGRNPCEAKGTNTRSDIVGLKGQGGAASSQDQGEDGGFADTGGAGGSRENGGMGGKEKPGGARRVKD